MPVSRLSGIENEIDKDVRFYQMPPELKPALPEPYTHVIDTSEFTALTKAEQAQAERELGNGRDFDAKDFRDSETKPSVDDFSEQGDFARAEQAKAERISGSGLDFDENDFLAAFVGAISSIVGSGDDVLPGRKDKDALESQEKSVKQTQVTSTSKTDELYTATNGYDPKLGTVTTVKQAADFWGRRDKIDKAKAVQKGIDARNAKAKAENVQIDKKQAEEKAKVMKSAVEEDIPAPPKAKEYDAFGDEIDPNRAKEALGGGRKSKADQTAKEQRRNEQKQGPITTPAQKTTGGDGYSGDFTPSQDPQSQRERANEVDEFGKWGESDSPSGEPPSDPGQDDTADESYYHTGGLVTDGTPEGGTPIAAMVQEGEYLISPLSVERLGVDLLTILNAVSATDGGRINQARIYRGFMQAYPNQDFRTKDGGLITDGDALTNQDDLPMELGEGAFVLSRAAVKRIGTEQLNRLNASARAGEQQVFGAFGR